MVDGDDMETMNDKTGGAVLNLDFDRFECTVAGTRVYLTPKEWSLLAELVAAAGKPMDRQFRSRATDIHMARVRKKLGHDLIRTIRGVGYAATDALLAGVIANGKKRPGVAS